MLPPCQALRLFKVWDSEGEEDRKDTVLEEMFSLVDKDGSDSEGHKKKKESGKKRKRKSSSKSSSSSSTDDDSWLWYISNRLSYNDNGNCLFTIFTGQLPSSKFPIVSLWDQFGWTTATIQLRSCLSWTWHKDKKKKKKKKNKGKKDKKLTQEQKDKLAAKEREKKAKEDKREQDKQERDALAKAKKAR